MKVKERVLDKIGRCIASMANMRHYLKPEEWQQVLQVIQLLDRQVIPRIDVMMGGERIFKPERGPCVLPVLSGYNPLGIEISSGDIICSLKPLRTR